jgi:hypothetical protein
MTHAQVAKIVRLDKEKHPESFCKHPKCLYRLKEYYVSPYGGWCPKHQPVAMVG